MNVDTCSGAKITVVDLKSTLSLSTNIYSAVVFVNDSGVRYNGH